MDLTRAALIVVDMQNGFCHERGFLTALGLDWRPNATAIPGIQRLRDGAREAGIPVFYTRFAFNADYSDAGLYLEVFPAIQGTGGLVRDSWDAEIIDELTPADGEVVINKTRYTAFYDTDLESRLRELDVDTVIVCGVTTNVCVESTVRDAFFRDFRVVVPSDATAAPEQEMHDSALADFAFCFGRVVTVAEIEEALSGSPVADG